MILQKIGSNIVLIFLRRKCSIPFKYQMIDQGLTDKFRKCFVCGKGCWGWFKGRIIVSVGTNNYLRASTMSRDTDIPTQHASVNMNGKYINLSI